MKSSTPLVTLFPGGGGAGTSSGLYVHGCGSGGAFSNAYAGGGFGRGFSSLPSSGKEASVSGCGGSGGAVVVGRGRAECQLVST